MTRPYKPPASEWNGPFFAPGPRDRPHLYPHVCLGCRSVFRRPVVMQAFTRPCPRCAKPAIPVWTKFKPPPRDDRRQWDKVEALLRHGFFFLPAGRGYPDAPSEVAAFAAENRAVVEGWRRHWPDYYLALQAALP